MGGGASHESGCRSQCPVLLAALGQLSHDAGRHWPAEQHPLPHPLGVLGSQSGERAARRRARKRGPAVILLKPPPSRWKSDHTHQQVYFQAWGRGIITREWSGPSHQPSQRRPLPPSCWSPSLSGPSLRGRRGCQTPPPPRGWPSRQEEKVSRAWIDAKKWSPVSLRERRDPDGVVPLLAAPLSVCIIGAGASGCGAAAFLRQAFSGDDLDITVLEQSASLPGGRIGQVNFSGQDYEAGASILHDVNAYAVAVARRHKLRMKHGVTKGVSAVFYNGSSAEVSPSDALMRTFSHLLLSYPPPARPTPAHTLWPCRCLSAVHGQSSSLFSGSASALSGGWRQDEIT